MVGSIVFLECVSFSLQTSSVVVYAATYVALWLSEQPG